MLKGRAQLAKPDELGSPTPPVAQKAVDEGMRAGVTGTPAFFIHGRLLSGAQPPETFVQAIEDELARAR